MPPDLMQSLMRSLLDPTAPLPAGWPVGTGGAFLLFLVPVGGGIPAGVLMARDAGVSPLVTALLYFASDVVLAFTAEPMLVFLRWLGRWVPALGRLGHWLARLTNQTGLGQSGARGPLGLILVSFTISPTTGRAAAAAAGHGFVPGWTLAIVGDMFYFALLMASTLWLSGMLGDERLTVGVVLIATWLLPFLIRRWRRLAAAPAAVPGPPPAPAIVASGTAAGAVAGAATTVAGRSRRANTKRRSARSPNRR